MQIIPATGAFGMAYVPVTESKQLSEDPYTLALIDFSSDAPSGENTRRFSTCLTQIEAPQVCEYWRSAEPVERIRVGGFELGRTSEVLFIQLMAPDSGFVERDAEHIYSELMTILHAERYPHLVRVWNYLPRINQEESGRERYQSFCVGRALALESFQAIDDARLPAASGLGASGGGLQVYAIAAREPGIQVENPRQISAFNYPPRYGPRSPSFSRATFKRWRDGDHLYISGTASIVGHTSMHDTIEFQLGETLSNIEAVVDEAHRSQGLAIRSPCELSLIKVYLRHSSDASFAKKWLRDRLGDRVPMLLLQGDICRSELLVEIEGAYLGTI